MSQTAFGNQIAMEWASFPVLSAINGKRRGQSYYVGDGLNHVPVGPDPVERVLASLRQAVSEPQEAPVAAVVAPRAPTRARHRRCPPAAGWCVHHGSVHEMRLSASAIVHNS